MLLSQDEDNIFSDFRGLLKLPPMCAVWNSGIEVIHAKDKIGEQNYKNAYYNGINSSILMKYLPKLVNE